MDVVIKVDPGNAIQTSNAVEASLAKVEAMGPKVSAALSSGLRESSVAAEKAKVAAQGLGEQLKKMTNPFGNALADQLKREADMFEKIRGPARDYEADLKALDMLLQKNAISTEEYVSQVTRMNQAIQQTHEKAEEASSPVEKLGSAIEMFALPAAGAAVLELGHKIDDLIKEMDELADSLTELENKAQKFVDASHDTKRIIDEQRQLSVALHSTLEPTIELYDTIRDGTDTLRISHDEQIRATRTLGEAVQIANKPLADASGLMTRFAYALRTGTMETREFKSIGREIPEIMDLWTTHFHKSAAELQQLVEQGKLGPRELFRVLINDTTEMDAHFAKLKITIAATRAELMELAKTHAAQGIRGTDEFRTDAQLLESYGGDSAFAAAARSRTAQSDGKDLNHLVNQERIQEWQDFNNIFQKQIDDAKNLTGKWHELGEAQDKGLDNLLKQMDLLPERFKRLGVEIHAFVTQLQEISIPGIDAWTGQLNAFGRSMKLAMDNAAKIGDARLQLDALREAIKAGGIAGDAAAKQYRELMTTINDGRLPATIKVFDSLHEPMRTWHEDMAATEQLFKSGAISATDYAYQVMQLQKADPLMQRINALLEDSVKRYDAAAAAAKRYREANEQTPTPGAVGLDTHEFAGANRLAQSDAAIFKAADAEGAKKLAELEKEYGRVLEANESPLDKAEEAFSKLNDLHAKGVLVGTDYTKALKDLSKELNSDAVNRYATFETKTNDALAGANRGLRDIQAQTIDIGKTIETSITGTFDKLNDAIIKTVTTGKASFDELGSYIEQTGIKLALQQIEGSIVSAFSSQAKGNATGVATGTSAASTMLAAAPSIGSAIGVAFAAAAQAGAAAAGATSGAASAGAAAAVAAGSAYGSETAIPYAAMGYSGRVGGGGGTDSKLFMSWVTPGEHVSIRTPEQQKAAESAGKPSVTVKVENHHNTRGELLATLTSGDADVHVLNVMRRNKQAIQSLLKK